MRTVLIVLALSISAYGQQPLTVTDFFLALPDKFFAPHTESGTSASPAEISKYRRSIIKVEDKANGYLRLEGPWEGWGEVAIFRRADGSYLIAHTEVGCGPACSGNLFFHEYAGGRWTDVTSTVLEAPDSDTVTAARKRVAATDDVGAFFFSLPRKGTEITFDCSMCKDGNDATLIRYVWNRSKFVRR